MEVYRVIDFDIFKAENELVISKSNLKQAATKGDVDQLKKEIKGLEIHFNEELARSESKIKSELFKQTDSLEKTLEVTAEMVKLTLKTGLRKEMDIVVERATLRTLEQMRKDRIDILGAVAVASVIPAKAGIQGALDPGSWAGMTRDDTMTTPGGTRLLLRRLADRNDREI